jgi:A/G-specific adenine glycosylase
MLQQTRVQTVLAYFDRFIATFPSVQSLAEADLEYVLKLWEGLGYYSRARNLQFAAKQIVEQFEGVFPNSYEDILKLKGVGEYTAGAIASICFNENTPSIDGNVFRVACRFLSVDLDIFKRENKNWIREKLLPLYQQTDNKGDFTQSVMELGEVVCTPKKVQCQNCPLNRYCKAFAQDMVVSLPRPRKKVSKLTQHVTAFFLKWDNQVALLKRQQNGLLALLFEFPNILQQLSREQAIMKIQEFGFEQVKWIKTRKHKHIFTHKIWEMSAYYFEVEEKQLNFIWKDLQQIGADIALPSAFKWILESEETAISQDYKS